LRPAWVTTDVHGTPRTAFCLDGVDDNVTFPFRTLPPGALTVKLLVRPAARRAGALFSD